jgi:translation initiation factor 3 subunit M
MSFRELVNSSQLYTLLLSALSVAPSSEATALTIKTLRAAISIPNIFDFQELASLSCVQQFQKEKNPAYDFLQVFLTGDLETYRTFIKSHPSWLSDNRIFPIILTNIDIDESKAERKIRLLTLATLSNTPSRTLPYSKIVSSLDIPEDDVEVWLIDIIRAGLVEGKLSQARRELLVHRSTYRTFGRSEWEDLEARLEDWKVALEGILASDQIAALKEQEQPQQAAAATASPAVNGTSEVTV